jgi:hypothetical protein
MLLTSEHQHSLSQVGSLLVQNLTEEPVFFDNTTNYKYNNRSVELTGLYQFNVKHRVEVFPFKRRL